MRKIWSHVLQERRNQLSFILVIVLFAVAMGMTAWTLLQYREHHRGIFELQDCGARIRYYDEVLTMSARMAALTGAPEWERRYEGVVPLLDQALAQALTLSPASREPLAQVDDYIQRLIAVERQAFALARTGRLAEAMALVLGEAYDRDKVSYAAGLERFMADLAQVSLVMERDLVLSLWILAGIDALLFLVIAALLLDAFRRQAQRLGIERVLGEIARRLVAPGQHSDEEIGWVLAEVMHLAGGDYGLLVWHGVRLSSPPKRVWLPNGHGGQTNATVQRLLERVAVQENPVHGALVWPAIRQLSPEICPFQTPLLAAGIESLLGVGLDLGEGIRLWLLIGARRALGWQESELPLLESALELFSRAIAIQDHEERLFRLATTDALTGLLNRRYFLDKLNQELKRLRRGEAGAVRYRPRQRADGSRASVGGGGVESRPVAKQQSADHGQHWRDRPRRRGRAHRPAPATCRPGIICRERRWTEWCASLAAPRSGPPARLRNHRPRPVMTPDAEIAEIAEIAERRWVAAPCAKAF